MIVLRENWRSGFESRLRHKFFLSKLSTTILLLLFATIDALKNTERSSFRTGLEAWAARQLN